MKKKAVSTFMLLALLTICSIATGPAMAKDCKHKKACARIMELSDRIEKLEHKIGVQEDIEAIRTLMYTYAYYMDRSLFSQVLDLFSDSAVSCEAGGRGVYLGKAGCTTLWNDIWGVYGGAQDKPPYGAMIEHFITKLVITVAQDRETAKSRGHFFSMGGVFGYPATANTQIGIYQLEYVKEDGVWKISKWWLPFTTTGYNYTTWSENPGYSGCPSDEFPPDEATTAYHPFPEVYVVPFHYPNPVTGQQIPQNGYTDPAHYWIGNWPEEWGECSHR